jgi:hypothetical protein
VLTTGFTLLNSTGSCRSAHGGVAASRLPGGYARDRDHLA